MTEERKKRALILAILFITVVINYMDRINLSVAATAIRGEFGMSTRTMGLLFSAFFWPYFLLQIPGGILADFVKGRILYPILLVAWSLATVLQGFVNSLAALFGIRALIGAFEAPTYPTNDNIVASWFPREKRASAISIYTSGQFLGLAFLTPILAITQAAYGWRGMMILTGLAGIIWAVIFYVIFPRNPPAPESIGNESTSEDGEKKKAYTISDLKTAFVHRRLWGLYLGQFCLGTMTIFFLTWFPTYLQEYRGIELVKSGYLTAITYSAAFIGVLLSGHASDYMVKKGFSAEFARKAPVLTGMLLSTIVIAANFTDDTTLIMAFLTIAFFGNGLASIAWVFVSLLAPTGRVGLIGGVFNMFGASSAIVTPIVIGFIVTDDSFAPALFYIGAAAIIGFLSYVFLVGSVDQIKSSDSAEIEQTG